MPLTLLKRIRILLSIFVAGLVISGATAIPLETELKLLVQVAGADGDSGIRALMGHPQLPVRLSRINGEKELHRADRGEMVGHPYGVPGDEPSVIRARAAGASQGTKRITSIAVLAFLTLIAAVPLFCCYIR